MSERKPARITDTSFRDAHQSLMATRMQTEHMLGVAELMDKIGFHSMEVWGGATFDSCMRFLDEDPWERLRKLRSVIKNTKLQMLLRGQNLVGYRHYADDVVEAFIKKAVANGIDIIRIFDALNDTRNMAKAMEVTRKEGAHVQATLSYTLSPVHNLDYFVDMASQMVDLGADSIAIKDMAGLISPYDAVELVTRLKEVGVPIQLHCHYTSGMASMAYLKAIEAGVDVVDTACSPLALGTSQPPTESLVAALKGTPYDTGLDLDLLSQASEFFKEIRKHYYIPLDIALGVDTNVLNYQIPGGMISNLASQLEQQKASHLLPEVLKEVPRVREDLGYPPLVTPTSQIVGSQAVVNVLLGERYKMISTEVKNYVRGLYGRSPAPLNEELQKKVLGDAEPAQCRPADLLEPQMEAAAKEVGELAESEEDVISYAIFPQVAEAFFKRRKGLEPRICETEKCGFPPGQKNNGGNKANGKKEANLEQLYLVDDGLLFDETDILAYPVV
ncbi:oxaloacetate decarboxylase subunit alpha [Dethiobacter alkaliphilus]|uniref:Conserved carboxylase region n=1 Tax=Dethiobacter alkaliphilus AHT 1 TaxID=555088 RepID=C0GI65_DETAL|nr:oxaloacetate decarboxylase subunit alpha [Dethiobacter alkaliphilus]EEG76913.1 Conserved carboxylase region [Dethiobacter alkaliphilus AHT 1]